MAITNPVKIGNLSIGNGSCSVFAGPCSVESQNQFDLTASSIAASGAHGLRGGIYKLRTNPNDFQGLGLEAIKIIKNTKQKINLPFAAEITDPRQVEELDAIVDCYQVGSRNMHNYALLKELGQTNKPIILKRGFAGLIKEWILAAEYISMAGNDQVILCERGIRTFENATRNTFDLNAIAYIKAHTHLPIIADPSHATGMNELVIPMALAALTAGADGIIVEVHHSPQHALSDKDQALTCPQFEELMTRIKKLLPALDRSLAEQPHASKYKETSSAQQINS